MFGDFSRQKTVIRFQLLAKRIAFVVPAITHEMLTVVRGGERGGDLNTDIVEFNLVTRTSQISNKGEKNYKTQIKDLQSKLDFIERRNAENGFKLKEN